MEHRTDPPDTRGHRWVQDDVFHPSGHRDPGSKPKKLLSTEVRNRFREDFWGSFQSVSDHFHDKGAKYSTPGPSRVSDVHWPPVLLYVFPKSGADGTTAPSTGVGVRGSNGEIKTVKEGATLRGRDHDVYLWSGAGS